MAILSWKHCIYTPKFNFVDNLDTVSDQKANQFLLVPSAYPQLGSAAVSMHAQVTSACTAAISPAAATTERHHTSE